MAFLASWSAQNETELLSVRRRYALPPHFDLLLPLSLWQNPSKENAKARAFLRMDENEGVGWEKCGLAENSSDKSH
jgi:hypothetical protein